MKTLILSAAIAFASLTTSVANADVIFDAFDGDAATELGGTFDATAGTLTRTEAGNADLVSSLDFQTLNGGTAILPTDVVTVTWVVDSITNWAGIAAGQANNTSTAVRAGVVTDAVARGNSNLGTLSRLRGDSVGVVQANRIGYDFGNYLRPDAAGQSENEATVEVGDFEITAASIADGYTVVQTISAAGVTTQYTDVIVTDQGPGAVTPTGGTTLTTVLDPFVATRFPAGTGYTEFINGAHFYAGANFQDAAGGVVSFSTATVAINAVPEPSSAMLLALGGIVFGVKRRRK